MHSSKTKPYNALGILMRTPIRVCQMLICLPAAAPSTSEGVAASLDLILSPDVQQENKSTAIDPKDSSSSREGLDLSLLVFAT